MTEPMKPMRGDGFAQFFVPGIPKPQGSIRNVGRRGGPAILTSDTKGLKPWRETIGYVALQVRPEQFQGPIEVSMTWYMPRPKSHFKKGGSLRPGAPHYVDKKPDIDKLERATLDALTGIFYVDDAQVCAVHKQKIYATNTPCGLLIQIRSIK